MSQELFIVRGLPGSGKSYCAKEISKVRENCTHVEADMFFMVNGEYKYDPSKIKEAHAWCRAQVKEALGNGASVVVSNTFTRLWEFEPYINMADDHGVPYRVIVIQGDWGNTHGVPNEVIVEMATRWEDFDGEDVVDNHKEEED